jgi:hypothetical protein
LRKKQQLSTNLENYIAVQVSVKQIKPAKWDGLAVLSAGEYGKSRTSLASYRNRITQKPGTTSSIKAHSRPGQEQILLTRASHNLS